LDGQEAVMAHVSLRGPGRPRVGRYGVDVAAIERVGVAAVRRAMQEQRIVVVDEIGKMELLCGPFKDAVLQAMGGPCPVVATVMARPNPWVDGLKAMPNVTIWEVTVENRDGLAEQVVHWTDDPRSNWPFTT
jgi:nucleoside-triphosphatase